MLTGDPTSDYQVVKYLNIHDAYNYSRVSWYHYEIILSHYPSGSKLVTYPCLESLNPVNMLLRGDLDILEASGVGNIPLTDEEMKNLFENSPLESSLWIVKNVQKFNVNIEIFLVNMVVRSQHPKHIIPIIFKDYSSVRKHICDMMKFFEKKHDIKPHYTDTVTTICKHITYHLQYSSGSPNYFKNVIRNHNQRVGD